MMGIDSWRMSVMGVSFAHFCTASLRGPPARYTTPAHAAPALLHAWTCNERRAPGDYPNQGERSATHELPTDQQRPTCERAPPRVPTRHGPEDDRMKAIAVHPGAENSVHLTDLPMP